LIKRKIIKFTLLFFKKYRISWNTVRIRAREIEATYYSNRE